ncbi:hypothetical protein AOQ84DRAFT_375857 [Glonium stellatum]|uniref:NACHT domain-containing protein n=1 Tax=Glonium stellatum TaxID=574774 RepID=A0A8E2JTW3_9PEZI|nr:hypothetical protein AOQ84DRAFT_375857 [Glonium stellatum]
MSAINDNDIFTEARDQFLASLSPEEHRLFSKCSSADDLIEAIGKFDTTKEKRWLQKHLSKVSTLCKKLTPYFDVIGVFVQSQEFASIAWGAIRLILQLANNYVSFFEKLANTLERIALELPQYEVLPKLWKDLNIKPSPRLRSSLCRLYVDLFVFFQNVARVFVKKNGGAKKSPLVALDLFWKPFDVRFQDFLEQLKLHRQLINDEILLEQYQGGLLARKSGVEELIRGAQDRTFTSEACNQVERTKDMTEDMKSMLETRHKDDMVRRGLQWIQPPEFMLDLERAQDLREDGTTDWLFCEPLFKKWRALELSSRCAKAKGKFGTYALWVHGNPGCGKTILASSVVDELRDIDHRQVFYFFFRSGTSRLENATAAYRAILAQILQANRQDQEMIDKISFVMSNTSDGQAVASKHELIDLLRLCLHSTDDSYVILDGVDECVDSKDLVNDISLIFQGPPTKILMFSRPNVDALSRAMPAEQCLAVGRATSQDIDLFCSRKLVLLSEEGLLPHSIEIPRMTGHLVTGADGMFLWARLMIDYLSSPALTPRQRVKTVMSVTLPEGLETMYCRIVNLIHRGNQVEQRMARWIIMWLAFSERSLTSLELKESLKVMSIENEEDADDFSDFERTVIMISAGLIEPATTYDSRYHRNVPCFRFIHLSAQEYFSTANSALKSPLAISEPDSHLEITRSCLQYLTFHVPAQPLSGKLGQDVTPSHLDETFPLSNYAALHWINHLHKTTVNPINHSVPPVTHSGIYNQLIHSLSQFLSQKFVLMAWIEASYVFQERPNGQKLLEWSNKEVIITPSLPYDHKNSHETYSNALDFGNYLGILEADWGPKLSQSPGCIWEEITAYTPSRFLAKNTATQFDSLCADKLTGLNISTEYFCKVSEVTTDGHFVGVLSIWPSRLYQRLSSQSGSANHQVTLTELQESCSGWIARYELWSISERAERTVDLHIPLNQYEIWLQICQSLHYGHRMVDGPSETIRTISTWALHFPVAISSNAHHFTILRDLYSLVEGKDRLNARFESVRIDLEFQQPMAASWCLNGRSTQFMRSWPLRTYQIYQYFFTFSQDGRYLFFMDNEILKPMNLALFELGTSRALKLDLVMSLAAANRWVGRLRNVSTTFHPTKPLLAFTHSNTVCLWAFKQVGSPLSQCFCGRGTDQTISFSSCGGYIVIKESSSAPVVIQPIPKEFLGLALELESSSSQLHKGLKGEELKHIVGNPNSEIASQDLFKGHCAEIGVNGSNRGVSVIQSSAKVDVRLWAEEKSEYCEEAIELTRLPNWAGIQSSTATVQLPKSRDEMISIILNKSAKPYYDMSEQIDDQLPAVIRRDQRAVKRILEPTPKWPQEQSSDPSITNGTDHIEPTSRPRARSKNDAEMKERMIQSPQTSAIYEIRSQVEPQPTNFLIPRGRPVNPRRWYNRLSQKRFLRGTFS